MKVLLKVDIDNIGYAGEVHKVSNGYGRNYLLPKGLAVVASDGMLKQAEGWRKKAEARRAEMRAEYEALAAKIKEVSLTFTARAGETGKLYGSITTTQIADAMNEMLGTDIDRRKVGVEQLRQLGSHQIVVRLSGDFQPELTVVVEDENAPEEFVMEEPVVATEESAAESADEVVAVVPVESEDAAELDEISEEESEAA
jgi:large subunit ribosomal protein L9